MREDKDYLTWLDHQAEILRGGELETLDRFGLADVIDGLAIERQEVFQALLRHILVSLNKLEQSKFSESRSQLIESICGSRAHAETMLERTGSLRNRVSEIYQNARVQAEIISGQMPAHTLEQVLDIDFFPD